MNYTTNFGLKIPQRGVDMANVNDLNDNTEDIDTIMYQNRTMLGEAYDPDKVGGYTEGDFVVQLGQFYECLDDTSGAWDPTKWQLTDVGTVLKALADGGGGGGEHTYSTQEQVVGTWLDGRNVYEKTYEVNTTTPLGTNTYAFNHGITNLDRVINYHGSTYWPGGAGGKMIPFSDGTDSIYVTLYNNTVIGMYLSDGMKTTGGAYYIVVTVQYIKTS